MVCQIKFNNKAKKGEIMAKYIVNYDLRKPGKDYEGLYKALNSYDNIHPMESCWIIKSFNSKVSIRDHLRTNIDGNDKLFVSELNGWASFNLTKAEVDWLNRS